MTDKLIKLEQKQNRINLQIAREKKKISSNSRKNDTRRKILIGALVIEEMKANKQLDTQINQLLVNKLVRDNDRALFELPLIVKK